MPVKFQKWITREDLQNNPDVLFLFGDNAARKGMGGQAKQMRGEPNAIGVRTKYYPSFEKNAFFRDDVDSEEKQVAMIVQDVEPVFRHLENGGLVVIPEDGIGSGLANLEDVAPVTHGVLLNYIEEFKRYGVVNE